MKILLISPVLHPITPDSKYIGIEKMVWHYARELVKEHDVSVIAHQASVYPEKVKLLGVEPPSNFYDLELKAYQTYQYLLRTFDVIHDWSHLHLASRQMVKLPSLNIFFHAPSLSRYPKSPYNIIGLSKWATREFKRVYHQEARYQYSIGIDTSVYKTSQRHRGERFLTIGRMAPEKGNLDAIRLCRVNGQQLDVVGGRGLEKANEPLDEYEQAIQRSCDGKNIKFLGEVSEEQKIKLMQDCKALIYITSHPEVTSHKLQEAMLCGAPVIVPNLGAMHEIVTDKVNGYICDRPDGFLWAMENIDKLTPNKVDLKRFSIENVVKNYIPLYKEVASGLKWA